MTKSTANKTPVHEDTTDHPRYSTSVLGHEGVIQNMQASWSQNRFPHGIILSGPKGIGKATLAYQMARHLLNPTTVNTFHTTQFDQDTAISKTDHLIRAQNHPDLFVLEKEIDDNGKLSKDIPIEKARSIVKFFSTTSLTDGWRVAIIDAVEDLSTKGANALLKILEEPPEKCLLILISHNQSGVLPTLTSRCQVFPCRPLDSQTCHSILEAQGVSSPDIYLPHSGGSPGLAHALHNLGGQDFLQAFHDLTTSCKQQDFRLLSPFFERWISKPQLLSPDQAYAAFCWFLQTWMASSLTCPDSQNIKHLDQRAASWFSLQDLLKQSHIFALDRKQTLMCVFYDFYGYNHR